ncbi:hypothetical protein WH357_21455 [Enterobacter ludwigii]
MNITEITQQTEALLDEYVQYAESDSPDESLVRMYSDIAKGAFFLWEKLSADIINRDIRAEQRAALSQSNTEARKRLWTMLERIQSPRYQCDRVVQVSSADGDTTQKNPAGEDWMSV